jgi:hypothetical protein
MLFVFEIREDIINVFSQSAKYVPGARDGDV